MKIIILGAGDVGGALAEYLVADSLNDITVIDNNPHQLQLLQDRYDLQTINGQASYPSILQKAGAADADMLVAVTSSDETNMLACQISYSLFNTPKRIARIRAKDYLLNYEDKSLFCETIIPVEHIISPELLVTNYIYKLVDNPGTLQVADFAGGKVFLVATTAYYGGTLIGDEIAELKNHLPYIDVKIVAIFRRNKAIRIQESTIIEAGDEIFFITEAQYTKTVLREFQRPEAPTKNILIIGGGSIGAELASKLENDYHVKVIEQNPERAEIVADMLEETIVLHGHGADIKLLEEEQIDQVDLFIAITNDDEANIMSSLLAKKSGAKKAIVLIQREAYIELLQDSTIDVTVTPKQTTISALLNHIRHGDITKVFSLRRGIAEAIEIVAHGTTETSNVIGHSVDELKLPPGTTIGAIVKDDDVFIASEGVKISDGDHVIMFLSDKRYISDIEKLFQPKVGIS